MQLERTDTKEQFEIRAVSNGVIVWKKIPVPGGILMERIPVRVLEDRK